MRDWLIIIIVCLATLCAVWALGVVGNRMLYVSLDDDSLERLNARLDQTGGIYYYYYYPPYEGDLADRERMAMDYHGTKVLEYDDDGKQTFERDGNTCDLFTGDFLKEIGGE
jgi:hypothetical protein